MDLGHVHQWAVKPSWERQMWNLMTLASWAKLTEDRLNREIPDAAISIFLFQDRVFVKGKLGGTMDPQRVLAAVQRDYLQMKRESPVLNDSQGKTMLVNLLTAK